MKITKRQLRRIIKEEVAHPRGDLGKNIADVDFPISVGYTINGQSLSEIAYTQDELDEILDYLQPMSSRGQSIPYSLDSLSDKEPESIPAGKDIALYRESVSYSDVPDIEFEIVSGGSTGKIATLNPVLANQIADLLLECSSIVSQIDMEFSDVNSTLAPPIIIDPRLKSLISNVEIAAESLFEASTQASHLADNTGG